MLRRGLTFGVVLAFGGCTSMRTVQPEQFIPQHNPAVVSVWTRPDDVTIVSDPEVSGDTLKGEVFQTPWAMNFKDIMRVEALTPDGRRTALLIAGSAVSAAGALLLLTSGHGGGAPPCFPWLGCNGVRTSPQ